MNWGNEKSTAALQYALMGPERVRCFLVPAPRAKRMRQGRLAPAFLVALVTNIIGGARHAAMRAVISDWQR